jgi:hypothetical protein
LTPQRSVHVYGGQLATHTGDGDQYIFSVSLVNPAGKGSHKRPLDEMRWHAQRFVHPRGFKEARDCLAAEGRTVLLEGPPGSGRPTAAKVLLWELRSELGEFHELTPQETAENGSSRHRLDLSELADGDGVWLDLSRVSDQLWNDVYDKLPQLRAAVLDHSARLVVVLPAPPEPLDLSLAQFRRRIEHPSPHDVLRRWLHMEGLPQPADFAAIPGLATFSSPTATPGQIARYVSEVAQERDKHSGAGDLAAWCAAVDHASLARAELAKNIGGKITGFSASQRALLLTTAALEGTHANGVNEAAATLLATIGHARGEASDLELEPLEHRINDIGATRDALALVTFNDPGYADAVWAYFWTELPELREKVRDWIGLAADSEYLTSLGRDALIRRFMGQCLVDSGPSMALWPTLVELWTRRNAPKHLVESAALIVQLGLHDETSGRAFRRQIYVWSRDASISGQLAEVIIAACRDEMALSHPGEALVRLHHLARRKPGSRALDTLGVLVGEDRWLLRYLLSRLSGSSNAEFNRIDAELFIRFAETGALVVPKAYGHPLLCERALRDQLIGGWRLAFGVLDPERWEPRAADWLRRAASDADYGDILLDILIAAGRPRPGEAAGQSRPMELAHILAMTRAPELPRDLTNRVLRKMNEGFGIVSCKKETEKP